MSFDMIKMTGTLGVEEYDVVFQVPFFNVVAFCLLIFVMLAGFKLVFYIFK
jgi:hypothetical protein